MAAAMVGCSGGGSAPAGPTVVPAPEARVDAVKDTFHGVEVADPYRWLEAAGDPEVEAWSKAQNARARRYLDSLPQREPLAKDLARILGAERITHDDLAVAQGRVLALRHEPGRRQAYLAELLMPDIRAGVRNLVDPEKLDPEGLTTIDWFVPSFDSSKLAVSMSRAGTESGDLYVYDVDTLEQIETTIPRVHGGTAGGALAWDADGKGFFYTRYPREGERPPEDMDFHVQLWHHTLGDDPAEQDTYVLGKELPRIAEIDVESHATTGRLLVTVQDGDGGQFAHWLRMPDGTLTQLSEFGDRTVMMTFSQDGQSIYAVSLAGSPKGRILRFAVGSTVAEAETVVPEGEAALVPSFWSPPSIVEASGKLLVEVQTGGPSEMRAYELDGTPTEAPTQFELGGLGGMVATPDGGMLYSSRSYTEPDTWFNYHPVAGHNDRLQIDSPTTVDLSGIEVHREMATSKDGTQVPVNILHRKGLALDGTHPCIVTGYGGYGVNLAPRLRESWAPMLANGVVMVTTNLRGGGEFGEAWHLDGNLTNKQNVFDDFHAALNHLVERGYTSRERLGIIGGSNGGLLMGATFTQHPDAMAAVVSSVGIYDMLRVELSPNGAFNVTEFGTVKDPEQFAALHAYSPYHHVAEGTDYPPVLFTTGANDPRVDPMQSRKMTARLQAVEGARAPVFLRTSDEAGHGGGMPVDAKVELLADQYAFLLHHLGVDYAPMPQ